MKLKMTSKCGRKSIKHLESSLQNLNGFENPKASLEQYITPPHIASMILNEIDCDETLDDKLVADLGCGTGMLSLGSIFCGAKLVYGFDIDRNALNRALANANQVFCDEELEEDDPNYAASIYKSCSNLALIQADIANSTEECDLFWKRWNKVFDVVIMNPPFGTKQNQGLDVSFLRRGIDLAAGTVYSLHKTTTRDFISRKCRDEWGVEAKPIAKLRYNIDNTYKFHRKRSVDIDVDLWRINSN